MANPVINQNGSAAIVSGQYCTWNTANGSMSTISISNSSRANNLVIVIQGAPGSGIIVQVNGALQPTLDNIFTLPPNSPAFTVIGTGDFRGSQVTITNITNAQNDASAAIQCVTNS
jgi:hypothetical protein